MAKRTSDRADLWRRVLEEWRTSGLTVAEFCRRRRIASPTFYVWRRRLGSRSPLPVRQTGSREPRPAFLPVRVVPSPPAPVLELVLRGGRVLRWHGEVPPARVAELVLALEGPAC